MIRKSYYILSLKNPLSLTNINSYCKLIKLQFATLNFRIILVLPLKILDVGFIKSKASVTTIFTTFTTTCLYDKL